MIYVVEEKVVVEVGEFIEGDSESGFSFFGGFSKDKYLQQHKFFVPQGCGVPVSGQLLDVTITYYGDTGIVISIIGERQPAVVIALGAARTALHRRR